MANPFEKLKGLLYRRRQAYATVFKNVVGEQVLADLAKFCRINDSTFHPDPRVHALLEGRREVFQRIADHLNLSPDELFDLYHKGKNPGE